MKLILIAFAVATLYAFVLCTAANGLLSSAQSMQQNYDHVAATADEWSAGNTSVSFIPTK